MLSKIRNSYILTKKAGIIFQITLVPPFVTISHI